MSFEQIEAKFNTVWKQIEDFTPIGSKEEAERLNRKGLRLEQESAKKLKTSEEVLEEVKSSEEVPKEKLKEMMQLVPIKEGRIVGNKMHKAFPLPVMEFPLSKEVSTASEEISYCQKKRDATAEKIALLLEGWSEGSWSDSGEEDDEKVKDETCLVAHALNENEVVTPSYDPEIEQLAINDKPLSFILSLVTLTSGSVRTVLQYEYCTCEQ
nr:hypothetical protein [Tanacetum cinerariifolium]